MNMQSIYAPFMLTAHKVTAKIIAQVNTLPKRGKIANSPLLQGSVAIVGAGCGELDLLTIKAVLCIQAADAVVYDSLVNEDILSLASANCERHYVGKRFGQVSAKQDDINRLLLSLALSGKRVVRLKGGDPHIFGRGAEEALYLAERGIKSQYVPGITAALGCAASAGIPLTYRGVARSVTFVTGMLRTSQSETKADLCGEQQRDESGAHWHALLSHQSTLVFYMGKEQAATIEQQLLSHGTASSLPLAFVTNGGRCDQVVTYGTLATLARTAASIATAGPSLLVIGEVVTIAQQFALLVAHMDQAYAEVAYG